MAESTSVALAAAPTPSSAEIARAEEFVRDRFLHEGEDAAVALAPGSPRRRALERALAELDAGAQHPSTEWRGDFSLLLGLERLLSDDEPKLADGTVLSAHQVDALSGTLTALLAEAQRTSAENGNGRVAAAAASPELLASAAILGPDDAPARNGAGEDESDAESTRGSSRSDEAYDEDELEASADDDEDDDDDDDELGPVQRPPPTRMTRTTRTRSSSPTSCLARRDARTASASPTRGPRATPRRSLGTGSMTTRMTRSPWQSSRRTPTPPSGSGSSTPPARARRSRRSGSWRGRRRAGS